MIADANATGCGIEYERENGKIRRRIDRFRRAGMFGDGSAVTIKQATTVDELIEAYRLVHDVFVQQNYIVEQEGRVRLRAFEALPEMATFVAKADGKVVAVMSVVPDTPEFGLPSDKAFKDELDLLRSQGRRVCETTNLAVDPNFRSTSVFLELVRCCIAHGLNSGYDDSFISISEGHALFFESVLGFEAWGDRRNYGDSVVDFVEGKRLDLTRFEEKMKRADDALGEAAFLHSWFFDESPYYSYTEASAIAARQAFLDPVLLQYLFVKVSSFLDRCGDSVIEGLRQRWGQWLLSEVLARDTAQGGDRMAA